MGKKIDMKPQLIDSHTHLETFHRAGRLGEVLDRAGEAGVVRVVTVGTESDDWQIYRGLAGADPERIAYTVGIHPCHVGDDWAEQVKMLPGYFAGAVKPVAIGEIGLDRFHLSREPEQAEKEIARQKEAFWAQLGLAAELDAPVVIHSRGAFLECVEMIDRSGVAWERVVFHCFTEGPDSMRLLVERGGRGSFTGVLTYKKAEEVREAALSQGLARFMIETDAPYLAPIPQRGKPNEPAYLLHTAEFAAKLFGVSLEEVSARTTETTRDFYRLG
jgi:TatD DNase family protein